MGSIKRGVSFYSYQQAQFFKQLDLEGMIREVSENLYGADGIEILDEQSIRGYPNPPREFFDKWNSWIERYRVVPVTMDVFMDVLQFRDHVMTYSECAERLKNDIRLAKKLGFKNVRTLSVVPIEVIVGALPVAEELDIRIGKEIHNPMSLKGRAVEEIVEYVDKSGTKHLGIVPDMGIFMHRPSEPRIEWMLRHGARREAVDLLLELCEDRRRNRGPLSGIDLSFETAGNLEEYFSRYLKTRRADKKFEEIFDTIVELTDSRIKGARESDYSVVFQALTFSRTRPEELEPLVPYIVCIHGKFYHMTEIPDRPGEYEDRSIDYEGPIRVLKKCGYSGYINSEYEGQRWYQDLPFEQLADEVDQVRKHQKMLKRLIEEV